METIIESEGLSRNFGSLKAVSDLSLSVGAEIYGLLGPNGSGKTTTVLMLTTLLAPSSGTATVCGRDILRDPAGVRRKLSYVPQDMAVDAKLTGRENVEFFAELYGVSDRKRRAREALEVLELADRADDLARTYSGGMRRRLEIAQALVHEPEVLFLDEPTIGLDVAARKKIWDHISRLRRNGMAVFVTTHYMDEADRYCDRVAIIDHGTVMAEGTPGELKTRISQDVVIAEVEGEAGEINIPGVRFAGREEDSLHFHVPDGEAAVPRIHEALKVAGLHVTSIAVRKPALDDVFLDCVSEGEDRTPFNLGSFRNVMRRR